MLGQNAQAAIFSVNTNTNYSSSDYNGFRPESGGNESFQWNSPPANVPMILADGTSSAEARDAQVRDARGLRAGDQAGSAQRRSSTTTSS